MPRRSQKNRTIEVLLLKQYKQHNPYEIIRVKPIFARNVLIPQGIATLVTPMVLNNYKQKIESAKKHKEQKLSSYKELISKIKEDGELIIEKKTNEEGVLYAQVSVNDILEAIKQKYGVELNKYLFKVKSNKIKKVGVYKVGFVYEDYSDEIMIKVVSQNQDLNEKKEEESNQENSQEQEESKE